MRILLYPTLLSFALFLASPVLAQKGEVEEVEIIKIIDIADNEKSQDIEQVSPTPPVPGEDVIMEDPPAPSEADDANKVFMIVEHMPEYPGGEAELMKYMATVTYPEEARTKNIEGKSFIKFVVEKDGSVSNIEVLRSANEMLDAAATAHIAQMPRWKPGMVDGKSVRVQYIIPVVFKLR